MEKIKELRMTLIILLVGVFFISGCFFNDKHTVTFKTNGGSEIKNVSIKNGAKLSEVEEPTKDGFVFDGWYLDGEKYDFDREIDKDITLVAKWVKDLNDNHNDEEDDNNTTSSTTTVTTKTTTSAQSNKTTRTTKKTTRPTTKATTTSTTTTTTKPPTTNVTTTVLTTTRCVNLRVEKVTEKVTKTTTKPATTTKSVETTTKSKTDADDAESNDKTLLADILSNNDDAESDINNESSETEDTPSEDDFEIVEYIRVTRTLEGVNVISEIDESDLLKILDSDFALWHMNSNHGFVYPLAQGENIDCFELRGDSDVTSLTLTYDGASYIFEYDEASNNWTIKYPTVSVGTGLDVLYYNNLETANSVVKKGETIRLLADQVVKNNLMIRVPFVLEADNYKVTNSAGYLFNVENIEYEASDALIFNNLVVDVDSLLYIGNSKFTNIKFNNLSGNIKGNKIDKAENGIFSESSIMSLL